MLPTYPVHTPVRLRAELRLFASPQVWLARAVGAFGFGGVFAVHSSIAAMLSNLDGVGAAGLTAALAPFGLGTATGDLLGGRLADGAVMPALYLVLDTFAAVLALFTLTAHEAGTALVAVFAIGAAAGLVISRYRCARSA
ncbi:hypothetical protein [Streptomyces sp. x-19]|uniref:hypothetical protein n=1 Tax=Streptomyces sp. x-19 TaxID=2789280 RepID=UPI00397FD3F4